ncbi:DUF6950 family protein [Rhizobium leguminosarum]|uniref:DUF6950 family protein n=1 Tax=Rhizobium leguminosarum TaxID=384 RepID=UPI0021BBDE31|nr:hypothetical protein [Rhizobium leguminosarum]
MFSEFEAVQNRRVWEPGKVDCCLLLADWAVWLGRADPAPHLRGRYDSEDGFRRIIEMEGGLIQLIENCVSRIGGRRGGPSAGAIGVIGSKTNAERQWGAIFNGRQWRVRFVGGIGAMTAHPLAIWEI